MENRGPIFSLLASTHSTIEILDELRRVTALGLKIRETFPELAALCARSPGSFARWEHEPSAASEPMPLLEHVADRALRRKLLGLEQGELAVFQQDDALSGERFECACATVTGLADHGLTVVLRAALLFLDFAKGGTPAQREAWSVDVGADLSIHNVAASQILAANQTLERIDHFAQDPLLAELVRQIVAVHGLAGQWVRGETPLSAFAAWVEWLQANAAGLGRRLDVDAATAVSLAADCLHLVDVCDTAAVREGLLDDALYDSLRFVRDSLVDAATGGAIVDPADAAERFARLRREATVRGEPRERIEAVLAAGDEWFDRMLANAQLWYFEPATHALSTAAAFNLLVLGLAQAERSPEVDVSRPWHLTFEPLLGALGAPTSEAQYRVRLVDALLREGSYETFRRGEAPTSLLATFYPRIGGSTAVAMELDTTPEADALVTLLAIYERRSSVAFHQILKLLCDAYGLRKDEFDRVANEADYLATMNAARSDKERLVEFSRPGTIVEIGPGGGAVLDLLASRFPDSDVVGLDASELVVDELRRRKLQEQKSWRVVHGDGFELPRLFGPSSVDTVVFCSVLHEIYSYVEWEGARFRLESVRALIRAAYEALRPGGRIVIRDGIRPPDSRRVIEFIDPDGPDFLRRFVDEFEGRAIGCEWIDATTAALTTADAMEFLYCYTWGPKSFPYEVRELYGIMERDEYDRAVVEWLSDFGTPGRVVPVPPELRSYLQPGYIDGLAPKVRLFDASGSPARLPDSNAMMVYEKPE